MTSYRPTILLNSNNIIVILFISIKQLENVLVKLRKEN